MSDKAAADIHGRALKEYADMMHLTGWKKEDLCEYRRLLDAQVALVNIKMRLTLVKKCLLVAHEVTSLIGEAVGVSRQIEERTNMEIMRRLFKVERAETEAV